MYKKLLKIFFVCCIMICTGCQSTPEVVEERMSGYGSNGQIKSDDINYCSLLELKNANLKDINVELDNMVLPEKIDFSQVESVEVLDMSFESGFTDNKERIAGLFGLMLIYLLPIRLIWIPQTFKKQTICCRDLHMMTEIHILL